MQSPPLTKHRRKNMLEKWIPDATGDQPSYKAYPIILLRLFAGFAMFFAGFEKLTEPLWSIDGEVWTAAGYLRGSAGGGALQPWFQSMAGSSAVDNLVIYGEMLIGIALILGLLVRFASIMGIAMNGLFWTAAYMSKSGGVVQSGPFYFGWRTGPLEINAALIAMYLVIMLAGAGLIYGLDAYVHKTPLVKKYPKLKFLLG